MISKWRYVWWPLTMVNRFRGVLRHRLFDLGVWKSVAFEVPVIYVGSLANDSLLGISMHIKNLTHGALHVNRFRLSDFKLKKQEGASTVYYLPLSEESVFCTKHKVLGLSEWYQDFPNTSTFVMDDEFMQNEIRPKLRILVTNYEQPFHKDALFPVGKLKESKKSAIMADAVIVYQTPEGAHCEQIGEEIQSYLSMGVPVFFIKNSIQSINSFNSADKIEFISDRHNFERLILNVLPNANPDSE